NPQRQTGLPAPPDPRQRHQPPRRKPLTHLDQLKLPPHERGAHDRKVVTHRVQRAQSGKLLLQTSRQNLKDPLRLTEIAQPLLPQIAQLDLGTKPICDEHRTGRKQHLAPMPSLHQPRTATHADPEEAAIGLARTTAEPRHPNRNLDLAPSFTCGRPRISDRVKHGAAPTPGVLEPPPPMEPPRLTQNLIMSNQQRGHRLRIRLPATRAPLDVRKQERVARQLCADRDRPTHTHADEHTRIRRPRVRHGPARVTVYLRALRANKGPRLRALLEWAVLGSNQCPPTCRAGATVAPVRIIAPTRLGCAELPPLR